LPVEDPSVCKSTKALEENKEYGISHWGLGNAKMESFTSVLKTELHYLALLYCGDSHFYSRCLCAIALELVLEVEMVLSTQCIMQPKPKKMLHQRSW
jgi:3-isopropylmalate/(R)-2-methylmalate dehydratase large subunit